MLTAEGHARCLMSCHLNVVDEAGKGRKAADEEGRDCTPIRTELGRVPVDAVEIVHVWDGNVSSSNDEVAVAHTCQ